MKSSRRWLGCYISPLLLISVGATALHLRLSVPGAPVILFDSRPTSAEFDREGNLFFGDLNHHCIWRLSRYGMLRRVVGCGKPGDSGEIDFPTDLAFDGEGNLYVAEFLRIRKVDAQGIITAVAGDGRPGFSGDGGSAINARLNHVTGISVDSRRRLYIADGFNHRVRRVDPNGIITTIAGRGPVGTFRGRYGGDGGPAARARLSYPSEIAIDAEGNRYITEYFNHCIRKVSPEGLISTIAGNRKKGYSGDGGPATKASLDSPDDIAIDATGNIYCADWGNDCVRKVGVDGTIITIAGNLRTGHNGEGGPAVRAAAASPVEVTLDSGGNLYFVDDTCIHSVDQHGLLTTVVSALRRLNR